MISTKIPGVNLYEPRSVSREDTKNGPQELNDLLTGSVLQACLN